MSDTPIDNLDAAMEAVASTTSMGRSTNTGSSTGDPANRQVLIRANSADHERWKEAAAKNGVSLSEFIRDCLNAKSSEVLDCQHPPTHRLSYPWAEICTACGLRLREGRIKKK